MTDQEPKNLEEVLDRVSEAADENDPVTMGQILDMVGRRSFGPLLLVAGVVTSMPVVGDIPGVPPIMGLFVVLVAVQMLFHREHLWLPEWLLQRSVEQDKLRQALEWMYPPAEFIDRWLRPRLQSFTGSAAAHVIALTCILIAVTTPVLEFIPFSANLAGAAITAFGLSLIAHDGLLSLLAFGFTAVTFGLVAYHFL